MAERHARPTREIGYHLLPVIVIVPDLFAVGANRNNALQVANLRGLAQNSFSHLESHPNEIAIERLCHEIV